MAGGRRRWERRKCAPEPGRWGWSPGGENSASRGVIAWMHEAPGAPGRRESRAIRGFAQGLMTRSKSREWFQRDHQHHLVPAGTFTLHLMLPQKPGDLLAREPGPGSVQGQPERVRLGTCQPKP